MKTKEEVTQPSWFINAQIPINPTASQLQKHERQMEESMNAKISENKKVSKQVQQIREIEMNIIKETMDRGFLVNQDEAGTCPKFYKNFTNCIQNHMQTDDLASISSK